MLDLTKRRASLGSSGSATSSTKGEGVKNSRVASMGIWAKLLAVLVFPVSGLCLFATMILIDSGYQAAAAVELYQVSTAVRIIVDFVYACTKERTAQMWLIEEFNHDGVWMEPVDLIAARDHTDKTMARFDAFMTDNLDALNPEVILRLSVVKNFMRELKPHRVLSDRHVTLMKEEEDFYNEGAHYCQAQILHLAKQVQDRQPALTMLAIADGLSLFEEYSTRPFHIHHALEYGYLTPQDLQMIKLVFDLPKAVLESFYSRAAPQHDALMMGVEVSAEWVEAAERDESYLALGVGPVALDSIREQAEAQVRLKEAIQEKVFGVLSQMTDDLKSEANKVSNDAQAAEAILYSSLILCLIITILSATLLARTIAIPYVKLHKAGQKLVKDSKAMELHTQVSRRFVPFETLTLMGVDNIALLTLGQSVMKRLTLFFGDLVGFTTISSRLSPDDTFRLINTWLEGLIPYINVNGGTIDKFLGDGIIAFFNSAEDAVEAAIQCMNWKRDINKHRQENGGIPLAFGLGCNSGDVMLGSIGTLDRMDTLTTSETVRIVETCESMTRKYKCDMLITEYTYHHLEHGKKAFRKVGFLPHENGPIGLYECMVSPFPLASNCCVASPYSRIPCAVWYMVQR